LSAYVSERLRSERQRNVAARSRDACQFVLTAIEVIDPKPELMAEELRLEVDKRLL
jgi:hypothetical protein